MTTMRVLLLIMIVVASGAASAQAPDRNACNVEVVVIDPDPRGANVRAEPGGSIVATLKNPTSDGWILVHLAAQQNGTAIYRDHAASSAKLDPHADGDQTIELLGCFGEFAKVRAKKGIGWTRQLCTNMVTTCS